MSQIELNLGRRFARLATDAVVRRPWLWRLFRPLTRLQFDRMAPRWTAMRSADAFASLEAALDSLPQPPGRALDLGTGTGLAAFAVARHFPDAEVVGADLSEAMVAQAQADTPPELAGRVRFQAADAAQLPFEEGAFELVVLANMIPFFDELERVVSPGGHVVFMFSAGPETPIWVPPERLRKELESRGFSDFADFEAGVGTSLLARKGDGN
ncbi:MAG: class I SAM-dependent methyltransferase [Actinobacteria bacterium]|nr:MAG: class I SAM-dependent methyltransferase [Actinomycetota bacterium]